MGVYDMIKLFFLSLLVGLAIGCDKTQDGKMVFEIRKPVNSSSLDEWADNIARSVSGSLKRWDNDAWRKPHWFNPQFYQGVAFIDQCRDVLKNEYGRLEDDCFRYRPLIARFYAQPMAQKTKALHQRRRLSNQLLRLEYKYSFNFKVVASENNGGEAWMDDNLYFAVNTGDAVKVVVVKLGELCTYSSCSSASPVSGEEFNYKGVRLYSGNVYPIVDDCFRGSDDQGLAEFFADMVDGQAALYWGIGGKCNSHMSTWKWHNMIPCGRYVFAKSAFEEWVAGNYGESILRLNLVKASECEYIFSTIQNPAITEGCGHRARD